MSRIRVIVDKNRQISYYEYNSKKKKEDILGIKRSQLDLYIETSVVASLQSYIQDDSGLVTNKVLLKYCNNIAQSKLKEHNIKRAIKPGSGVSVIYGSYWCQMSNPSNESYKLASSYNWDENDRVKSWYNVKIEHEAFEEFLNWIENPYSVIIETALIKKIGELEPDVDEDYIKLINEYMRSDDVPTKQLGFELLAKLDPIKYRNIIDYFLYFYDCKRIKPSKEVEILRKNRGCVSCTRNRIVPSLYGFNEAERNVGFILAEKLLTQVCSFDKILFSLSQYFNITFKKNDSNSVQS